MDSGSVGFEADQRHAKLLSEMLATARNQNQRQLLASKLRHSRMTSHCLMRSWVARGPLIIELLQRGVVTSRRIGLIFNSPTRN